MTSSTAAGSRPGLPSPSERRCSKPSSAAAGSRPGLSANSSLSVANAFSPFVDLWPEFLSNSPLSVANAFSPFVDLWLRLLTNGSLSVATSGSSGRSRDSAPPRLPTGVRAALTMYAACLTPMLVPQRPVLFQHVFNALLTQLAGQQAEEGVPLKIKQPCFIHHGVCIQIAAAQNFSQLAA